MTHDIVDDTTRAEIPSIQPPAALTLFDVLYNSLVLRNTIPHLPVSGLLSLASTCRDFRSLIYNTPGVFRHLDLTHVKTAHFDHESERDGDVWHNVQLSEYLTEDDFYSGPLRGVFYTLRHSNLLRDVQTLILDGLSVTAEMCHEIINDSTYSVRMLSIRNVKNLNQGKLRAALAYACRRTRPEGAPRLKALYVFGSKDSEASIRAHDSEAWWSRKGRVFDTPIDGEWARCLVACQGLIAFDAVLCQGPRHANSPVFGRAGVATTCYPAIATFAVGGCASCGKAPEGLMDAEKTPAMALPLLAPPPVLSSSVQAATMPTSTSSSTSHGHGHSAFAPRCVDCLRERCCVSCNKWWCEACFQAPSHEASAAGVGGQQGGVVIVDFDGSWNSLDGLEPDMIMAKSKPRVTRSCWECGINCNECIARTQKICRKCCGGYCLIHNEGSSSSHCDWCVTRGRGLARQQQRQPQRQPQRLLQRQPQYQRAIRCR